MTAGLERYFELWRLEADGMPFRTPTSTIQFARKGDAPCVLKIGSTKTDEATAAALSHYRGHGAVTLLAHERAATLLQRASPGTPLSDLVYAGRDDEATRIVCRTMAALHAADNGDKGFRRVEDWGAAFTRPAAFELPPQLVAEASAVYADLCRTQTKRVLLHGDLHHDNILFDADFGWLAIDPKGIVGEPEYEAGAALRNPGDDPQYFAAREIVDRRARIICEMQGWNRNRVLRWCFAQGVLSAIWSVEDGENPKRGLSIANATRPLI